MKKNNYGIKMLLNYYLRNWRFFLICLFISVIVTMQLASETTVNYEMVDMPAIRQVEFYYRHARQQEKIGEQALYMNIDSQNVYECILLYGFKTDDSEKRREGVDYCKSILDSSTLLEQMQEAEKLYEIASLKEFVFVNDNGEENIFKIRICSYDEESCNRFGDVLGSYMQQVMDKYNANGSGIYIEKVDQKWITQSEQYIEIQQMECYKLLRRYSKKYEEFYKKLGDIEKSYFDTFILQEGNQEVENSNQEIDMKNVIKNIINYSIVAVFIYIVLIYIKFSFNKNILVSEELEEAFGLTVLSSMRFPRQKKRVGGFIDNGLQRIMDIGVHKQDNADSLSKLKKYLNDKTGNYDKICIMNGKYLADWKSKIKDFGIEKLVFIDDYGFNNELEKISEQKVAMVIVVELRNTSYQEIAHIISDSEMLGIEMLGVVTVEETYNG